MVPVCAALLPAATVDFGAGMDPPLVKKFAQYNAGLPPLNNYPRDLVTILPLRSDHLRLDLGMGKGGTTATNVVTGTAENPVYNFTGLDRLARMLLEKDVLPYYSWCYVPAPLHRIPGDWRSMRSDAAALDAYRRFHREFGAHYRDGASPGLRMGYHEIYNEPDLPGFFFIEPFELYMRMYQAGATGIREGDPEAVVGGPALAIMGNNARLFTQFVATNNLPLDFFSFHHYGVAENYGGGVRTAQSALAADARFRTVPIHINEFNSSASTAGAGSINNRFGQASRMFSLMERALGNHDVIQASWAQYMDWSGDGLGLVRTNGQRKAGYNAVKIYADMPEDRKQVVSDNAQIGAMASASGNKAALVAWNRGDADQTARFDFSGLPFASGRLRVYRIDAQNASFLDGAYEDLRAVETRQLASTQGVSWSGTLPARGVVYLTLDNGAGEDFIGDLEKFPLSARPGRVLRTHHWFPARGRANYAYFDRKSWSARLGMGTESAGYSLVAARVDSLSREIRLRLAVEGNPRRLDASSVLGVRVDYAGTQQKAVLVHWGIHDPAGEEGLPWGTGRGADSVIRAGSEDYLLPLAAIAPPGWNGKAVVSFLMRNTGAGSRAVIQVGRGSPQTAIGTPPEGPAITPHARGWLFADARSLRLPGDFAGADLVELRDRMGRIIRTWKSAAGQELSWNGQPPPPGLYHLRIKKGGESWSMPLKRVF